MVYGLPNWVPNVSVRVAIDGRNLYRRAPHPPLKDYSAAVAAAIEWLGNRYLLARPVNVTRHFPPMAASRRSTIGMGT
jgi:hypothetical protein